MVSVQFFVAQAAQVMWAKQKDQRSVSGISRIKGWTITKQEELAKKHWNLKHLARTEVLGVMLSFCFGQSEQITWWNN